MLVVGFLLAACSAGGDRPAVGSLDGRQHASSGPRALEPVVESAVEETVSALVNPDSPELPKPLVDTAEILAGGPPPDGIPPVDEPRFENAQSVQWLADQEPVLALEIGGQARAYPVQILIWHEIVNDTVDGVPVSVTYCPLCNSAIAFDRRVGDRLVTFGTSGKLYKSDLVMYDRQTESLWPQIEGRAVAGVLTGSELLRIPVATVPWDQWRQAYPDGWVLSRQTGYERDYGRNPYQSYDQPDSQPFLFDGETDPRLPPKERVVAIDGSDPVAVPLQLVAAARVLSLEVAGSPVVIWGVPGLRSALDTDRISDGRRIAASGVFDPTVDGRVLRFAPSGRDQFVDARTGSTWNVLGLAVSGRLKGTQLAPVAHIDTFWFAWAAFRPETRLEPGQ
jgi:hypothetical protein